MLHRGPNSSLQASPCAAPPLSAAPQQSRGALRAFQVYIVCNAINRRQITAWAAGRPGEECRLPAHNVLCNDEGQGHRSGILTDTASAIRYSISSEADNLDTFDPCGESYPCEAGWTSFNPRSPYPCETPARIDHHVLLIASHKDNGVGDSQ